MQDAKEEVRARLNIEDVIGDYVQLKRAGRNFKGLSPFTSEKTPSFFVSPDKHIWHDFSSNRGGDVFSFVMEVEGMDFRGALEHLARKAGVDLGQYDSQQSREISARKARAREALELASTYYQHSLLRNKHAVEYVFKHRRLTKQIVSDFRIGYAPDSGQALRRFLEQRGFTARELSDAGLTNRFGGDIFRGRMTVPLMDGTGGVVGFTARIIDDVPDAPKYLNTPQTLLYDKARHVFALSQAKSAIRSNNYSVIVEGNLDVVSSHMVGVRQVVATAGTALSEHHLRALKRLSDDIRLAFDGDRAGIAATERAIGIASRVGVTLTIVSLPDGAKDPDELIQREPASWQRAIEQAVPAVDWILSQYQRREDLSTARGKRAFTTAGLAIAAQLQDPVEREHYEKKIAQMSGTTLEAIRAKSAQSEPETTPRRSISHVVQYDPDPDVYQDNALAVATLDAASQELFAHIDPGLFSGDHRRATARYFADHHKSTLQDTPKELHEYDTYVKILLLKADTRYGDWNERDRYFETARLIRQVENEHRKQTQEKLINELRQVEAAGDESRADEIRTELNKLIKEIARGQRR